MARLVKVKPTHATIEGKFFVLNDIGMENVLIFLMWFHWFERSIIISCALRALMISFPLPQEFSLPRHTLSISSTSLSLPLQQGRSRNLSWKRVTKKLLPWFFTVVLCFLWPQAWELCAAEKTSLHIYILELSHSTPKSPSSLFTGGVLSWSKVG